MKLKLLAEPFPAEDIEWRVASIYSGKNKSQPPTIKVLAYVTARAIMQRLDDVCGPENWKNTSATIHNVGVFAVQVGIAIKLDGEWVTKYDVSEPPQFEPAKGSFSGAMKRAGSQWGIGRYLYGLTQNKASVAKQWKAGSYRAEHQGEVYWWTPPALPAWALPEDDSQAAKEVPEEIPF